MMGQRDFESNTAGDPQSASSLYSPQGVALDHGGRLWVGDGGGSRVLEYDGVAPVSCSRAVPGMLSWWPGDGDARDIVSGYNGTLMGTAMFASGLARQAFSFDGGSGYVSIGDPTALKALPQGITIEAWVNPNTTATGNYARAILSKWGQSPSLDAYGLYLLRTGLDYTLSAPVGNGIWEGFEFQGGMVVSGQWTHVAMTFDNATEVLYVNGQQVATRPWVGTVPQSDENVYIGNEQGDSTRLFDGLIDEVRVYNRALAAGDIAAIHAAGTAGVCTPVVSVGGIAEQPDLAALPPASGRGYTPYILGAAVVFLAAAAAAGWRRRRLLTGRR